jgi:hypothetical protein
LRSAPARRASAALAAVTAAALIGLAGAVPANASTCPAGQHWVDLGAMGGTCGKDTSGGIGSGSGSSTVVGTGGGPIRPAYRPPAGTPSDDGYVPAPVRPAPKPTKVGTVLKADKSGWAKGATLKYRWLRNGVPISGAWSSTYKVRSADKGKTVTVRVTGTKNGHKSTKTSKKYTVR